MSTKESPPRPSAFDGYDVNHHYRTGSPSALLAVIRSAAEEGESVPAGLVLFVGAAARREPEIAAGLRALRDGAAPAGRPLLDAILRESERPPTRGPARSAEDLDARWSEFFATGDVAPVREIVAVLAWKDWLREHVESLLRERRWTDFLFGAKRRSDLAERLRPIGIRVDLDRATVENATDVDGVIIRADFSTDGARVKALQSALPRPLTAPELMTVAVKTSAIWSLATNACSHPVVVDACLEALPGADARVRLSLAGVLAHARLARGEFAAALALAEETLAAEPHDARAIATSQRAREGLAREAAWALLDEHGEATTDPAALRGRAQQHAPEGYRALAEMRSNDRPGNPRREGIVQEHDATFRGDRVHCVRWFWDTASQQALADEWITVPPAHYEFPGLWVRVPPDMAIRDAEDQMVRRDPYVALTARAPDAAERLVNADGAFIVLRYDGVRLPTLAKVVPSPEAALAVTVWLREADGALVGAVVRASTGDEREALALVRTVFLYGELVRTIEAPTSFIDGSNAVPSGPAA